ncbi:MAG: DNRLRE domain-containing protein [Acidobacteriota bacterium]
MSNRFRLCLAVAGALCLAASSSAQVVKQLRGVDSRVDYASLSTFGPWDDRNYTLTQEDLDLLAPNEAELTIAIPAWYRVAMRKANPDMRREGPAQYPHSALPAYRLRYGGYLVEGTIYRKAERGKRGFRVLMNEGIDRDLFEEQRVEREAKFLSGEVRVTSPNGAAESAIKINPVNTNLVIAGSNGPGSGQIMHYSSDGGDTWNQAAALPGGGTCCDPTVDWSSDGTLAYTATLGNCGFSGCQIWFYRSSDNGQTWNDISRRTLSTGSGNDKEFIHVDKFATSPHKDNIYVTWHDGNVMQFARSTDQGLTFARQSFSSASADLGIGSDITTDKAGDVYYVWPAFNSRQILLAKSTDGGATFGATSQVSPTEASFDYALPSMETRNAFIYVSADTDFSTGPFADSIYLAWSDTTSTDSNNPNNNHSRVQVAYSRDGGSTWSLSTPHATSDANTVDRYNQWLAVDASGRVHIVYYDTRNSSNRTGVDVYYAFSDDGAQTWSSPTRVTAQLSPNIADSFEWGDYNGLDAVLSDVIAIYTDNRSETGGGGDSIDIYAAGLQSGGGGNATPAVSISAPADGSSAALGASVSFSGSAGDAEDGDLSSGLAWTSSIDGAIGSGASFQTSTLSVGAHTITASATDSGGLTGQDSIALTVFDPNTGGALDAVYDAGLGAPACLAVGTECDSTDLLEGRGSVGPEQNASNTLDTCTDGNAGSYLNDESNERIVVRTVGGGDLTEGATVEVEVTAYAWNTGSQDTLDLYFTDDAGATNPSWTLIGSQGAPAGGLQTFTAQYTLPAGGLQAVRANFRYQGSQSPCSGGTYDDADDLVFAVAGGGGGGTPVTVTFTSIGAEDGWVRESNETSNVGGARNTTGAGARPIRPGDATNDRQYKSILSFDTSSIPDGATVQSATLRLRRGTVRGSNPFTGGFGQCLVDIQTGGFSGSTALQNADFQAAATAPSAASLTAPAANGDWSEGVLNAAGVAAINLTGTTQARVFFEVDDNDDGGDDHMGYFSGDNSNAANHPQLVVTYVE